MKGARMFLFRLFIFTARARLQVLTSLQVQLRAGIGVRDAFALQQRISKDHQVRRLADLSLSSLSAGQPFSARYAASGYFPEADARLLAVAERHGALVEIIELLKREQAPDESFWQVAVLGNLQWLMGLVAMLAITMYGVEYERLMTLGSSQPLAFFAIGKWLNANLWWVLALALLGMAGYVRARRLVTGKPRLLLRELGVFTLHDQQQLLRLGELLTVLLRAGIAQREALEETAATLGRGYAETGLRGALTAMASGESMVEGLSRGLLGDADTELLLLQSGRETPRELAQAMDTFVQVKRDSLRRGLIAAAGLVASASALSAFALLIPMVNALMGAGLATDF